MTVTSHLAVNEQDGIHIIGFTEPTVLDAYHVDEISKRLYELIDREGPKQLILDFSAIKMLSSQTLSVMLKMRQKLMEQGGTMVISGINPGLYRVFKITNLQSVFEFFENNQSAIDFLKQTQS